MSIKIGKKTNKTKIDFPESAKIILRFGKYKNKSLKYIYNKDPKYIDWLEDLDNLYENYKDAISDIRWYEEQLVNQMIYSVLDDIERYIKRGEPIYYRDLEAVGCEYIIDYLTIGETCSGQYWLDNKKYKNINITKDKYEVLKEKLVKYWEEDGKQTLPNRQSTPKEMDKILHRK